MFFLPRPQRLITRPLRFLLVNSVMLTTLLCLFSFLSLAGYAAVYQALMPTVQLERSVHFKYAMRPCKQNEVCEHPVAKVVLPSEGLYPVLTAGTEYKIELALELPESDANMRMGMFMASIKMNAADGETLRNAQRSTVLVYRSTMLRTLNTLLALPSLLFGRAKEKQLVRLIMFDRYVEPSSKFTHSAEVEVHKADIQIYSAKLRILADFGGVRYLMYYWPLTSAAVGITFNFSCFWMLTTLVWLRARLLPNLRRKSPNNSVRPQEKSSEPTAANQSRLAVAKNNVLSAEDRVEPATNRSAVKILTNLPAFSSTKITYIRSKLAALIDLGFSWSPISLPKFFVHVVLTVVSPEYSSKKYD